MSHCPWCDGDVKESIPGRRVGMKRSYFADSGIVFASSFAGHVQRCAAAPESVKAAYRRPLPWM